LHPLDTRNWTNAGVIATDVRSVVYDRFRPCGTRFLLVRLNDLNSSNVGAEEMDVSCGCLGALLSQRDTLMLG
jgi:hypothetical protein